MRSNADALRRLLDEMAQPRRRDGTGAQIPHRLRVLGAIAALLAVGAFLRIIFALCAPWGWVRAQFKQAKMPEEEEEDRWW